MDKEPDWQHYRSFLAVLEEGSLSAAARSLGLAQPTLGRHVELLEAALGTTLFTRSPAGLAATDAAQALRPFIESMRATAQAIDRHARAARDTVAGTVRLGVSEVIGIEVMPAILASFRQARPGVVVELVLSDRNQDLLQRDADIAVRMAKPEQEALLARRIGAIELGLYAHPSYLKRRGEPRQVSDLASYDLVGFDEALPYIRRMSAGMPPWHRDMFALRSNSNVAQLAAVRAGFGIGFCQVPLAVREPVLTRVLPSVGLPLECWVVMHGDLRGQPACKALFDALVEGLLSYLA